VLRASSRLIKVPQAMISTISTDANSISSAGRTPETRLSVSDTTLMRTFWFVGCGPSYAC
jgi:hypothetical protein